MEAMNGVMPVYNLSDAGKGDFMGGDWIWIFLFFILFGMNGNGFGGGNGVTADYLANQTSRLSEQILTQANATNMGVSNATYTLNDSLNAGFNGVNSNLTNLGYKMDSCCCQNRYDALLNTNSTNSAIADLKYDLGERLCTITNNQERNTSMILQAISQNAAEAQIRELTRENARLAQQAQTVSILAGVQDLVKNGYSI